MSVILANFGQKPAQVLETASILPHEPGDVLCINVHAMRYRWQKRPGNGWQRFFHLTALPPEPPCAA